MNYRLQRFICALFAFAASMIALPAYAQQDTTSMKDIFSQFSLRDLLNVSIVTVSKQE